MRTNPKTIKLAKIRRYIREGIVWFNTDNGMPEFYSTENYKTSKKKKYPVHGDFPYYVKSNRALREIAEKIYSLMEEQKNKIDLRPTPVSGKTAERLYKYTICGCKCGCQNEIPSYNITGLCLHCYRDHRTLNKEEKT